MLTLAAAIIAAATSTAALNDASSAPPAFKLPPGEKPLEYTIDLTVDPSKKTYDGSETIKLHVDKPQKALFIQGRNITVQKATVNGAKATWKQLDDDGMATLTLDKEVSGDVDVVIAFS